MGTFKEHAYAFQAVAQKQRSIYNDAADYGFPYLYANPPQEIKDLLMFVDDLKSSSLLRKREAWKNGVTITIRIGWEVDEGVEKGTQYTITFNYLGRRYMTSPNALHKDCDSFITVDISLYSEPYENEKWIDPAGGVHHGQEGDPAKMYE
jgi:hypothetical protein